MIAGPPPEELTISTQPFAYPNGEADQASEQETRETHRSYNGWVDNLDNAIRTQFMAVGHNALVILEEILMIHLVKNGAILLTLIIALTGCHAPVLNVKDAQVKTLSGKELTLDQVTKAIVLAGMGLKWEMNVASPGHIVATLNLRGHQAVVDIPYNTSTYSIIYKSSVNLTMTPVGKKVPESPPQLIHKNYNGWIENLDNAIRTQFIAAGP